MFRVLVSDKIAKEGLTPLLDSSQITVVERSVSEAGDLETYDALLVRSATKVTAEVLGKMPKLKIIGRAGVGVDNIDVAAATQRDRGCKRPRWQHHRHCGTYFRADAGHGAQTVQGK